MGRKVLIVDDQADIRELAVHHLAAAGYGFLTARGEIGHRFGG